MKRTEIRHYRITDAELMMLAGDMENTCRRDLEELINYGVDEAYLDSLVTNLQVFKNCPDDCILSARMMQATEDKNLTKTEVMKQVRQVTDRARILWGVRHANFRMFDVALLSKQKDKDLVRIGYRVVEVATAQLADLSGEGLTIDILNELNAIVGVLDTQINIQRTRIIERDIAVDKRIMTGNVVYAMISKLAAKGKLCWQDRSEARYNDYLITNSKGKSGNSTEGIVSAGAIVNVSVTKLKFNTDLILSNKGNVTLSVYFAEEPTDSKTESALDINPGDRITVSALKLGFRVNKFERLNVCNESGSVGKYKIRWE